jgi:anti-sigma factor RsiW
MNCPLESRENTEQLLDYCTRNLDPQSVAALEQHLSICPACRKFAENQRAVSRALDGWEAAPVSADFDARLYRRIEEQVSWWQRLVRPLRPVVLQWNVAASAAGVFVVLAAGLLIDRPPSVPAISKDTASIEAVQPDQVEHALDAMDTLAEFSHNVKDSSDAKM